jgi:PAS domain S-box-containing protein
MKIVLRLKNFSLSRETFMSRIPSPHLAKLFGSFQRTTSSTVAKYVLAVLTAVAALLFRTFLIPLLGEHYPYHTAWLAVVFSAWYLGVGPSIVAVAINAVGIWYWFMPPTYSFTGKHVAQISGWLGFLIFSTVIIALGGATRRSIRKRERAEEELRRAHEDLEERVKERTAALAQRTAELGEKAVLLDLANDAIFIKDANGTISYWNKGAERLYGWTAEEALGQLPQNLLRSEYPVPLREIESQDVWEGELAQTTRHGDPIVVASRWTTLCDHTGAPRGWMEINTDITARIRAEDAARRLSGRILTLQDDERRRLARGLHDSLGQYLAALKMNLDLMATSHREQAKQISDCTEILERSLTETRTVSHLLHPPLLDEAGFGSAARWYVEGFAQRSGIEANLTLPEDFGRLPNDAEITLFRALQEGLTNVHRHSGSSQVDIRLGLDNNQVRLEIRDYGAGMPPETLKNLVKGGAETGIGIAGMRERARELGGSLRIQSDSHGTLLTVVLPVLHQPEKITSLKSDAERKIPAA